ncbi:hypothetical protein L2E82_19394 [Cichorium intybus]|uniref:Uncharacterized protein n=1 Tax=Cichorium intybus TaxID=13427 RepID=A0ACB9FBT6_CICIN|nr:hypothetical protein L2E82_19394 [Cichorium intybus]
MNTANLREAPLLAGFWHRGVSVVTATIICIGFPYPDFDLSSQSTHTSGNANAKNGEAQDLRVSIELLPLSRPNEEFNVSLFYNDLIELDGDELALFMPLAGENMYNE